ncbi:HEAT repeat domain-containing protein [Parvularcula sp. IMCC14364]|uniref:HEAT repeat domain-containing protein n=1 Tax=Parvularcula sp. IMCC14364 TaxID=3067902 RepID=UPI0027423D19|nr:HEAT repeat domain-containing protein [Parvularcula sp. IMCC14364]
MTIFTRPEAGFRKAVLKNSNAYLEMLFSLQQETRDFYRQHAPLARTIQAINELPAPTAGDIVRLAEEYIDFDTVKPLIDYEASRYTAFPMYYSPMTALNTGAVTGWVLINHPKVLVMLIAFDSTEFRTQKRLGRMNETINFSAGDISLRLLKSGGFTCSHWQAPLITDDLAMTGDLQCVHERTKTYKTGDRIFTKGGTETIVYEDVAGPTIGLQVYSRIFRTNVMADYDPVSHLVKTLSAADQRSSRVQMLNTVARLFDRQDAVPPMQSLMKHPDHYVRWQTARELVALDPEAAEHPLRQMSEQDANPDVRRMAARTLQMFYTESTH